MAEEKTGAGKLQRGAGDLSMEQARIKVMSDPARRKILRCIVEHGPIAPVEIQHRLKLPLSKVSYNSRVLRELNCIEVVKEEQVRGSIKHWFVATERPMVGDDEWEQLDPVVREGLLIAGMEPMLEDFERGLKAGTIGTKAADVHMTREPLRALDAEGFRELREAHQALFEETSEIARRAAERMAESGEEPISVSSSQLCFRVDSF